MKNIYHAVTDPNTRSFNNAGALKVLLMLAILLAATTSRGQTTVFTDNFDRGAVVSPLSNGGTPTMTYTTTSTASPAGSSATNLTSGTDYALSLAPNATTPAIGRTYDYGSLGSYSSPFTTTLNANPGIITWTFNLRTNRSTALSGFDASQYVDAMVLVANSSDFLGATTKGYVVYMTKGTSTNKINLGSFTAGLSLTSGVSSFIGPSAEISGNTNFVSVKVTYNPTGNIWQLFVRDDASSTVPGDPTTVTTQVGSNTSNTTNTSVVMSHFGYFWNHSNGAANNNTGRFDNFKVVLTPGPTSIVQLTNGIAPSPLVGGSTNKAFIGFSLTSALGTPSFTAIKIQTSSTSVSKLTNIKLFTSADNSYATSGDNSQVTATVNQTSSEIQLSAFSQALSSTAKNFFIVADIDNSVTGSTTNVQPSFTQANVTVSEGIVSAATVTGTNYSFSAAASPVVTVTGSLTSFGNVVTGNSSTAQSYSVSGSDLIDNLAITAPSGFEISKSNTPFAAENPISFTPSSGTVSSKTIWVRFSPAAANGANSANVTNASTNATTQNVVASGTAISAEPVLQCSMSFGSVTTNSIVVNFSGGDGTNRIVVARSGSAVSFVPTDGTLLTGVNNNFSTATDQVSGNKVVYDGTGSTVTVLGLGGNTNYYFAVYEYNVGTGTSQNYLTTSPGNGNQMTPAATYTWTGSTSNDWQVAGNWSPERMAPATSDILQFNNGGTNTITNVPSQTIAKLLVSGGSKITLQGAATATLTIAGAAGDDLSVTGTGTELNISGTNALTISLNAGVNGLVTASMTVSGGAHMVKSTDANSLIFAIGSVFKATTGFTGNVFGTTPLNVVKFQSGSRCVQTENCHGTDALVP